MKKYKKILLNGIILILVLSLTLYYVFSGENLVELWSSILNCRWQWIFIAGCCVIGYIGGESYIICNLLHKFGYRLLKRDCFMLSRVGFFFSAITPSAGGGQPMQMYMMKRLSIPISISGIVMMLVTITFKMVLLILYGVIWLLDPELLILYFGDVQFFVVLGVFLNVCGIAGLLALVLEPEFVRRIVNGIVAILQKTKFKKKAKKIKLKADLALENYHEASVYIKKNLKVVFHVQLLAMIQRMFQFCIPVFVYLGLALSGTAWLRIAGIQSVISLAADMLPVPGGMGISEFLFQNAFEPVFGEELLTGLVLSRGISYYAQLLISATGTAILFLSLRFRNCKKFIKNS